MVAVKGWKGNLRVADTEAGLTTASNEDYIDDVGTNVDGGLEALHQQGSRLPKEINDGLVKMKLTVKKKMVDGVWAGYAGVGQTDMIAPMKYVGVYPFGYVAGKMKIVVYGKFGPWAFSSSVDGYAEESLDFTVQTISIGTV